MNVVISYPFLFEWSITEYVLLNLKGVSVMNVIKQIAIALVVVKPGSKDMQTMLIIDKSVKSIWNGVT